MNVHDAMETAAAYLAHEQEGEPLFASEQVAIVLAVEVERLRAELSDLRKDWCDDDEAIKQQALRVLDAAKVEGDSVYVPRMGALAEMMANEMVKVRAELAAAKAASVPPAKFWWCYESNECDILIHGMNDEDSTLLGNWLDDRMKERGE